MTERVSPTDGLRIRRSRPLSTRSTRPPEALMCRTPNSDGDTYTMIAYKATVEIQGTAAMMATPASSATR